MSLDTEIYILKYPIKTIDSGMMRVYNYAKLGQLMSQT